MEHFVDKILQTDQKAREIIEAAEIEKNAIITKAKKDAHQYLMQQQEKTKAEKQGIDTQLVEKTKQGEETINTLYLTAKHAIDEAFDTQYDAWLAQISQHIFAQES